MPTVTLRLLFILAASGLAITAQAREPIGSTEHFAFFSDFETNLSDALLAAGVERRFDRAELFHGGPEAECFGQLPETSKKAWKVAVDYYSEVIAPTDWNGSLQYPLRAQLAGFDPQDDGQSTEFLSIASALRSAAAPAYRQCRWPAQHAENLAWIDDRIAQLGQFEAAIAKRLANLYQKDWHGLPIRIDVVSTVSWSGANSVFLPGGSGGHLLIATSYTDAAALEVVFHEASHLMMGREDPVRKALGNAVVARDMPYPSGIWHVVLFNTTGEVVRQALADSGVSEYTPMIFEIYQRSDWAQYRDQIDTHWYPYINGEVPLEEAAEQLIAAIAEQED